MESDKIIEVGIDTAQRLYVKPKSKVFPYIYREAMEVEWDEDRRRLYGAKPRQWNHVEWFNQLLNAAKQQGCELTLAKTCNWVGVSDALKVQMLERTD